MRIFLIGYMGAGKTVLGKVLARRLNLSYVDTDHFIENRYHKKVSEIFASEGEDRFRDLEHRILLEIAEFENIVVSTGGGMPCFNNNMDIMNKAGITVYLDVPIDELASRLGKSKNMRPVLKKRTGSELFDFIKESLNKRKLFYEQAQINILIEKLNSDNDLEYLAEKLEAQLIR